MNRTLDGWAPWVLGIVRIVVALIFLEHGTQKLLGFPPGDHAGVAFGTLSWWSGALELVLGALIAAGLFTRIAAFLASGEMAVAYWMAHAPQSVFPINNGGDGAILYCFVFLLIVFTGPGAWSVDGAMGREAPASRV